MNNKVRVRFAPSPTGDLHIGGVRTALFNWLFARHNKGDFILRIEDTDKKRSSLKSRKQILSALNWLGLNRDEGPESGGEYGPYYQSKRGQVYQKALNYLLDKELAYKCYCTPEEVEELKKKEEKAGRQPLYPGHCRNLSNEEEKKLQEEGRSYVIKLKTPDKGNTIVNDLLRDRVYFDNTLQEDFIIAKSNGEPAYNFACVVDDHAMNISHIIRADEHLSNTHRQIMLYNALDYELPEFAHVAMILAPDRSKLSKRHGATSVDEFREKGFLPQGLLNYLLLLGWSPGNDQELMNLNKAIKLFSLEGISKNAAIYDKKKMTWFNGQYMRNLDLEKIIDYVLPFLEKTSFYEKDFIEKVRLYNIIDAVRQRSKTINELINGISYFYNDNFTYDEKGVKKHFKTHNIVTILENDIDCLKNVKKFNREKIEEIYRDRSKKLDVKAARMIHTTRMALSGRTSGPGLFTLVELIGREESIKRLERALEYVNSKK